jgi:hypothetical protein
VVLQCRVAAQSLSLEQPQAPEMHARPLALPAQSGAVQHWLVGMQAAPHTLKPALQVKPQLMPSQVAAPSVGAAHAVHEVPQLAGALFETQALLHLWKPEMQLKPQWVPSQLAVLLAGVGHAVQEVPQLEVLSFAAQALSHL